MQGTALRDPANGFEADRGPARPQARRPGGYQERAWVFDRHVDRSLAERVQVVTAAADARDLSEFAAAAADHLLPLAELSVRRRAGRAGRRGHDRRLDAPPSAPSSLDDRSAAELAAAYEKVTGRPWLQPPGLAHALVEVAVHALRSADDPGDRHAVAAALAQTRLDTICGTLDWTAGPAPSIARVPLTSGRWIRHQGRMQLRT
ncbi:hypothetical protein GCM10022267_90690 [Lentzea roselyniae]|uniref:Uncharacterized protein n=1 Tax=Lentzea roselyniae TaxID=531940 RepID=A0ABP7CKD3_9PSEU